MISGIPDYVINNYRIVNIGIIIYYLIMNVINILLFKIDKSKAMKNQFRISERRLISLCVFGGGLGGSIGMIAFKNKTGNMKFKIVIPICIIIHCITLGCFIVNQL